MRSTARSDFEGAGDREEPRTVTSGDTGQCLALDGLQRRDDRASHDAPVPRQGDEKRAPVRAIERTAHEVPGLEPIENAAQRRRTVTEAALELSDGVLATVGEQSQDVRLALGDAGGGQQSLETHSRRMGRSL